MISAFEIEFLKTKRTMTRKLVLFVPILACIIGILFFSSTGYLVQSIINQWSLLWSSFYIALTIGIMDKREKDSTQYKAILGSPVNLFNYELGRILNGTLFSLLGAVVQVIIVLLLNSIQSNGISIKNCIFAILGIFVATIWEILLCFWLSRIFNIYVSILLTVFGVFVGLLTNIGNVWPYSWPAIFPVPLTRTHINGLVGASSTASSSWTLVASIILFIVLSCFTSFLFKKQVEK